MDDFSKFSEFVGCKFDVADRNRFLSFFGDHKVALEESDCDTTVKGQGVSFRVVDGVLELIEFSSRPDLNCLDQAAIGEDDCYRGSLIKGIEFGLDSTALDAALGTPVFIRSLGPSLPLPENASDEEFSSYIELLESRRGEREQRFYRYPTSESLLLMCELSQGALFSIVVWNNNEYLRAEAYEYSGRFDEALKIYLKMDYSMVSCFDLIRCYRKLGNVVEERRCLQEALALILPPRQRDTYEKRLAEIS